MGFITDYLYHLGLRVDPPSGAGSEALCGLRCHDYNKPDDESAKREARRCHAALLQEEAVASGSVIIGTLYKGYEIMEEFPAFTKE